MFVFEYYVKSCVFFWIGNIVLGEHYFESGLEPGHVKEDIESVEEVRGVTNETTTEKVTEDEFAIKEAVLDVAYYLRRFKFNGYDPRYLSENEKPQKNLFAEFPIPPLRNLHWEVKKNCDSSFVECVKYLQDHISRTVLPRHLDSSTIIAQTGWTFEKDRVLIKTADDECVRLLELDENTFDVFSGPLQRFQWLTSAIYYMCWYTMKEVDYLKFFSEKCDNYASCIQWNIGLHNHDIRSDNRLPFACALYSFCPDPCCPFRYLKDAFTCFTSSPCSTALGRDKRCLLIRENNIHFESIMLNRWNVSCNCDENGMRWDSKSGLCVDIDECFENEGLCHRPLETCKNLPGHYKCVCSPLGYQMNPITGKCEDDPILQQVLYYPPIYVKNESQSISDKFADAFYNMKTLLLSSLEGKWNDSIK